MDNQPITPVRSHYVFNHKHMEPGQYAFIDACSSDGSAVCFVCEACTVDIGSDLRVGASVTRARSSERWEALERQSWSLKRATIIPFSSVRPLSTVFVTVKDGTVDNGHASQLSYALHKVIITATSTLYVPYAPVQVLQLDVMNTMPVLTGASVGRIVAGRTNIVLVSEDPAAVTSTGSTLDSSLSTPAKAAAAGTPKGTASPWKSSPGVAGSKSPVTPSLSSPWKSPATARGGSATSGTADQRADAESSLVASPAGVPNTSVAPDAGLSEAPPVMAGHEQVFQQLCDLLLRPFQHQVQATALRVRPPTGILLHGPPGCGKTLLVRCLAHEAAQLALSYGHAPPYQVFTVNGSEVMSPIPGESERRLRTVFLKARECANALAAEAAAKKQQGLPLAIVFMDEIDAIAPKRSVAGGRVGEGVTSVSAIRLVTQLLTLLDGADAKADADSDLSTRGHVVVIGATNRPQDLDPALRRPGRLDREVRLDPPSAQQREAILRKYVDAMSVDQTVLQGSFLADFAAAAIGFVGADLQSLCVTAQTLARKRSAERQGQQQEGIPPVTVQDFEAARVTVSASSLRGLQPVISTTRWADIGGMDSVVARLQEAVEAPLRHGQLYRTMGLSVPRGLLLFGPPGNSKTTLVRALACSVHASFFSLSSADVLSAYVGEAEATLREAFARARRAVPSILFLDEIDAMVGKRGIGSASSSASRDISTGLLTTLLTEMDGVVAADGVLIVAATNRPDALDPALLRPGRLELHIEVPSPDEHGRLSILQVHTRHLSLDPSLDLQAWAREDRTKGWSGAELENLCREAAMCAMRQAFQGHDQSFTAAGGGLRIGQEHFQEAWGRLARAGR